MFYALRRYSGGVFALKTGTVITILFIQMVHGMEITAEVWAIIRALEQIKDSIATKYIVFTDSRSYLQPLNHMKLEHPLIGMVIPICGLFKFCQKRHCFLLGTQPYWH